jgi:replicative DNA helicase
MTDPNQELTPNLRVPPSDIQAEASVLGAMMIHAPAVAAVQGILCQEDFYRPAHQAIYAGILELSVSGDAVDLVTIRAYFEAKGQLQALGGIEYIVAIVQGVPTAANVEYYAKIVRDHALRRRLITKCVEIADSAWSPQSDPAELAGELQQMILALSERGNSASSMTTMHEAMDEAVGHYEAVAKGEIPPGVLTGFNCFDRCTGGFQPGDLVVLAARPSVGKSALALSWATYAASAGGLVLFFSAEMGRRAIASRELCSVGGISPDNLKTNRLHQEEYNSRERVRELARQWGFALYDRAATARDVCVYARQVQARHGRRLGLIVIDYLQIMRTDPRQPQVDRYGLFAWACKCLAMDLGCPVVLLSQLNRSEGNDDRPPDLQRLRGSGNIEEHANTVIMLHRPREAEYLSGTNKVITWASVQKCRDGATTPRTLSDFQASIRLAITPHLTRFE